jgi:PTH1 family peptidyl-tRNA hydrolase
MVADELASRWGLSRPKDRFRGHIAEGAVQASSAAEGAGLASSGGGASGEDLSREASREDLSRGTFREDLSREASREDLFAEASREDLPRGVSGGGMSQKTGAPRARARVRVALLWPQTYMNDAGRSVGPARGSFKLPLERVLVVHDEIDLPFGEVRTRLGGGLAGHNGLKSIKRELGGAEFMRVRVGVGRPASTDPEVVSSYVLGRFRESPEDVANLIERACGAVDQVVLSEGASE